jgi:hypothetical protein
MISVVLPVLREEPALVDTLAVLVSGVAQGLVRDVVIAAVDPSPLTERIADSGGCVLLRARGDRAALVLAGLAQARSAAGMVLEPGLVPGGDWIAEVADFFDGPDSETRTAVFRLAARAGAGAAFRASLVNMAAAFGRPDPRLGMMGRISLLRDGAPISRLASPIHDRRGRR